MKEQRPISRSEEQDNISRSVIAGVMKKGFMPAMIEIADRREAAYLQTIGTIIDQATPKSSEK